MKEITREYVLEVITLGIAKHGSIAAYERAAGLEIGHIKDIRKWPNGGTEIPRADRWGRMIRAAGIESMDNALSILSESSQGELNGGEIAIIYVLKEIISMILNRKHPTKKNFIDDLGYALQHYRSEKLQLAVLVMDDLLAHIRDDKPHVNQQSIRKMLKLSPPKSV